ncbi:hypothetical protein [Streptomyces sp. SP18CS02]|uniref:hypothetical protein n=1 Tax=Streptomyces sp. SP18CS02 TaxID=3002531 RepID=UPI002E770E37|nr:hypothetical protein [Streptomyces sp. SP18CS02]MEE1752127.1 hypothetical protein [Streptomyces sp. SP18CS02]
MVTWAAAFMTAAVLVGVLNTVAARAEPPAGLAAMTVLAALLGIRARFAAAPGTAMVCWLFLNGFATPAAGELSWAADHDPGRLVCLLLGALAGTVAARAARARAAYRRVTPAGPRGM